MQRLCTHASQSDSDSGANSWDNIREGKLSRLMLSEVQSSASCLRCFWTWLEHSGLQRLPEPTIHTAAASEERESGWSPRPFKSRHPRTWLPPIGPHLVQVPLLLNTAAAGDLDSQTHRGHWRPTQTDTVMPGAPIFMHSSVIDLQSPF